MFGNVMRETAPRRAMSAIINALDLEIIKRRDTCASSQDRAELRMFILTYTSFKKAWDHLNPDTDPVSYALAWDEHLNSMIFKGGIEKVVHQNVRGIMTELENDIKPLLPVSTLENIRAGERALSEIVDIDRHVKIAA